MESGGCFVLLCPICSRCNAGGLPIGAVLVKQHVADVMLPGDHGSTFAGNPLVCHAANAVVDVISDPAFLSGVRVGGLSAFRRCHWDHQGRLCWDCQGRP